MNIYTFSIGYEDRHQSLEIRAANITEALQKLEELMLEKYNRFSILVRIGGQVISVSKIG